jgi:predicted lipoprotein with Yx(FWY)xxD motif
MIHQAPGPCDACSRSPRSSPRWLCRPCSGSGDAGTSTDPAPAAGGDSGPAEQPAAGGDRPSGAQGANRAAAGTRIEIADSDYGSILFGPSKRAIYLFDRETSAASRCYGACATAWPPVLTEGPAQAGAGAHAGLLGTTRRDDGSVQVTYDGHPLYYYVDDPPGKVLCQGVEEFGGTWLVVDPSGKAVR